MQNNNIHQINISSFSGHSSKDTVHGREEIVTRGGIT